MAFIPISKMMEVLDPFGPKTRPTLTGMCRDGVIPSRRDGNSWMVDEAVVDAALTWRNKTKTMDEMIRATAGFYNLSDYDQIQCRRSIRRRITPYLKEDEYSIMFTGPFIDPLTELTVQEIISGEVAAYTAKAVLIPVKEAAAEMGISVHQAKTAIKAGTIIASRIGNDVYISTDEIQKFKKTRSMYIGVFDATLQILSDPGIKSLFDPESQSDRMMLRNYVMTSSLNTVAVCWDEAKIFGDRRNSIYIPVLFKDKLRELLIPYLKRYGMSAERLEELRKDPYWDTHPRTQKLIAQFGKGKLTTGMTALLEMLVETRVPEIMECTDEEIETVIDYARNAPTQIYAKYAVMFINYVQSYEQTKFSIVVKYDYKASTGKITIDTTPYSLSEYMAFAYLVFSQPEIDKNQLVSKALATEKYALMWLYSIWHYVTAWRTSDFYRMPVMNVKYSIDELAEMIKSGKFTDDKAVEISLWLEHEINGRHRRPEKTCEEQLDEYLVVTFPMNLRAVIGIAYTIACAWRKGSPFAEQKFTVKDYEYFYGPVYTQIFGSHTFSNRRGNKSFMISVQTITENEQDAKNKILGYMVASFARAHASGSNGIAGTTYKYLKYKMDGMSIDEVLMTLWDLGCCSFVPYMLMEILYGEDFTTLPVTSQAQIVRTSGITPHLAETSAKEIKKAYLAAREVVGQLFSRYNDDGKRIVAKQVIENICNGTADGKMKGVPCLCAARRVPCPFNQRKTCIGCPLAIRTISMLMMIIEEIDEKTRLLEASCADGERRKWQMALEATYIPAALEVLEFCKEHYQLDTAPYRVRLLTAMQQKGKIDAKDKDYR